MNIDGTPSGKVIRPETVADLAAAIKDEKGSIVPMGAGTRLDFGNPLQSADCVVDLAGLNRITTYNPAELTIHMEAGARLGNVLSTLAAHNQTLPLDPWNGPNATIGGIAALNAQGPLRATGTIRDWIIGMSVVHVDGRTSKTGGRVVKNVTGYDLAKLYTGSLGTLAIITEISFKVRPQFGKTASAIAEFEHAHEALGVVTAIRKSAVQPISCELAGPKHAVWVRFGEHPQAVDAQITHLPPAPWRIVESEEETALWSRLREQYDALGPIVLRVIGTASEIGTMIETYRPNSWIAHALNGIVLMGFSDAAAVSQIRERFPAIIEKAPLDVRRRQGAFGVRGIEKRLMQDMKRVYDPQGRLNPGRHIDGE